MDEEIRDGNEIYVRQWKRDGDGGVDTVLPLSDPLDIPGRQRLSNPRVLKEVRYELPSLSEYVD